MTVQAMLGVIVVAAVIGIGGGAAVSKMLERELGFEAAEKYNGRILKGIMGFVLLALLGSLLLSLLDSSRFEIARVWSIVIRLVIIGGGGGSFFYIIWNRRRLAKEELLLDAGRNKPTIYSIPVLLGGYLLLDFFFQLIRALLNNELTLELSPELLGSLLLIGLVFPGFALTIFYKVYFIEEGVLLFRARPIKWEHIRDYSWGHRNENQVFLILNGGKRIDFSIDGKYREQVEDILQTRVEKAATTS